MDALLNIPLFSSPLFGVFPLVPVIIIFLSSIILFTNVHTSFKVIFLIAIFALSGIIALLTGLSCIVSTAALCYGSLNSIREFESFVLLLWPFYLSGAFAFLRFKKMEKKTVFTISIILMILIFLAALAIAFSPQG